MQKIAKIRFFFSLHGHGQLGQAWTGIVDSVLEPLFVRTCLVRQCVNQAFQPVCRCQALNTKKVPAQSTSGRQQGTRRERKVSCGCKYVNLCLIGMASTLIARASTLSAMASTLVVMASNQLEMAFYTIQSERFQTKLNQTRAGKPELGAPTLCAIFRVAFDACGRRRPW